MEITGCRFTVYPACDNFAEIILGSLGRVDTSKVEANTDHMSTVYRGKQIHVLDCAKAVMVYAHRKEGCTVAHFTFSKNRSSNDSPEGKVVFLMAADDIPCNAASAKIGDFYCYSKVSLYPLGESGYIEHIDAMVKLAEKHGLKPKAAHYVTMLEGSANALFNFFDEALSQAAKNLSHFVLEASVSINSPSTKNLAR